MARYKPYDLNQAKMIPLSYADQIVEGSFEHALNDIVEGHLDLMVFAVCVGNGRRPASMRAPTPPSTLPSLSASTRLLELPARTIAPAILSYASARFDDNH